MIDGELIDRAERWQRAIEARDVAAASSCMDDDFALVISRPRTAVVPRAAWLGLLPDYVISAYDVEERVIDVDGDVATLLQRVRMEATVLGEDRSGTFVTSDIWRRRNGVWKVWRRHSTPFSAGELPSSSA